MMVLSVLAAPVVQAVVEWRNLDDRNHLCGRKTSADYLVGKVVLVDRWGAKCPPCRKLLPLLEIHWQSFKSRQFVLLGGHCEGWGSKAEVQDLARAHQLTYPIYEGAGLLKNEPQFNGIPFLYVVNPLGQVVYRGRDDRLAVDYIVGELAKWESPEKLQDWKNCLSFEIENLPGHALIRHEEFARKFPLEAANYKTPIQALSRLPGIPDLVKLLKIVNKLSEYRSKDKTELSRVRSRISQTISKYSYLKKSSDPQIAREARNALADLQWIQSEL